MKERLIPAHNFTFFASFCLFFLLCVEHFDHMNSDEFPQYGAHSFRKLSANHREN
jgi:hypothetical protein